MKLSSNAETILSRITVSTKLGDLRNMAKEIKKDHDLAMELWSTREFLPRQLAILIMDPKLLTQEVIDQLDTDMQAHSYDERTQLIDWLMANQLAKDKKTTALIGSWQNSPLASSKAGVLVLPGTVAMDGPGTSRRYRRAACRHRGRYPTRRAGGAMGHEFHRGLDGGI
jgi:hypothetical protein